MEDRRCLYGLRYNSLPLDNVLSQGGGPLAVEGVLLKRDVIYHVLLYPTPSVTYRCQHPATPRCCEGAFGASFPIMVKQISAYKNCSSHAVSGNPQCAYRTNYHRLFPISTNEKQAT